MRASTSALALVLAAALCAPASAQSIEIPEAARADPANWPRAASPDAMSDAETLTV